MHPNHDALMLLIDWQPFHDGWDNWDRFARLPAVGKQRLTLWNHSKRNRWMLHLGRKGGDQPIEGFGPDEATFEQCLAKIAELIELPGR